MRINKNIIIAFSLIILSLIIGWLSTPYIIESYFNNQPIYSISESKDRLNSDKYIKSDLSALSNPDKENIYLSQSIVLQGKWNSDYVFFLTNPDGNSIQLEPVIDKINCIPIESKDYKIVGAYNLDHDSNLPLSINGNLKFYVIWILGGCD